jgi:hypothetical protein
MCTYQSEQVALSGSAKTPDGWRDMATATIYVDHPVHYPAGHALMVDVANPAHGPAARVALELDEVSARELAAAILRALDRAPAGLL